MSRDTPPMRKYTIRLVDGDPEKLERFFPEVGYNAVIRKLVNNLVKQMEEKLNRKLETDEHGRAENRKIADNIISNYGHGRGGLGDPTTSFGDD